MNHTHPSEQQSPVAAEANLRPTVRVGALDAIVTVMRAWDLLWAGALLVVGVVALIVAIVKLDGLSLAYALIAISGALMAWCIVKAAYFDADND